MKTMTLDSKRRHSDCYVDLIHELRASPSETE